MSDLQHGAFDEGDIQSEEIDDAVARAKQERMRRAIAPRLQRTRIQETGLEPYNVADFDANGDHVTSPTIIDEEFRVERRRVEDCLPLEHLVPGYEIVNGAGLCYCTIQA